MGLEKSVKGFECDWFFGYFYQFWSVCIHLRSLHFKLFSIIYYVLFFISKPFNPDSFEISKRSRFHTQKVDSSDLTSIKKVFPHAYIRFKDEIITMIIIEFWNIAQDNKETIKFTSETAIQKASQKDLKIPFVLDIIAVRCFNDHAFSSFILEPRQKKSFTITSAAKNLHFRGNCETELRQKLWLRRGKSKTVSSCN